MSNHPQNQHPNWNQQNQNQNYSSMPAGQHSNTESFQHGGQPSQELPPFVPGGVVMTQHGPVVTMAIKYKTIAHRGWSTVMFILVALAGIGTFLTLVFDPYYLSYALTSTLMLAVGAGVVHMLESIVAELRRLG